MKSAAQATPAPVVAIIGIIVAAVAGPVTNGCGANRALRSAETS